MPKMPSYDPAPLASLRSGELDELREWVVQEVLNNALEQASVKAADLADRYGVDPQTAFLFLVALMRDGMNAGAKWRAAEVSYAGLPFTAIADAMGWAGTGNVKRAIPELDALKDARREVETNRESQDVLIDGWRITLAPLES